ncbi:MAG: thiamine phosphate synthase [Rhodoplanes sp.]|nr:thiamine phosphate synthase [Rhodoplanes sp.]
MPDPPLLVVTDRRQAARPLADSLDAAFAAGARWASIREKDLSKAEQAALAKQLLHVAERHGARLLLHGDPEVAKAAALAGVHLPAGSDPQTARARLGEAALIGVSVHTPAEAARLDPAAVDYALAGPAFATASKPGYGPALEGAGLAAMVRAARVPVLAIGGITVESVPEILAAGVAGVAVMGGVMRATDPGDAVRRLPAALAARTIPGSVVGSGQLSEKA